MDEKELATMTTLYANMRVYTETNFYAIQRAFKGVSRQMKKQNKAISNVSILCGIGFLCAAGLLSVQNNQIMELQTKVKRLECTASFHEAVREGEADDETDAEI